MTMDSDSESWPYKSNLKFIRLEGQMIANSAFRESSDINEYTAAYCSKFTEQNRKLYNCHGSIEYRVLNSGPHTVTGSRSAGCLNFYSSRQEEGDDSMYRSQLLICSK